MCWLFRMQLLHIGFCYSYKWKLQHTKKLKLKLFHSYFHNFMSRLNILTLMEIEHGVLDEVNYKDLTNEFNSKLIKW